jgi:hypothetical protein
MCKVLNNRIPKNSARITYACFKSGGPRIFTLLPHDGVTSDGKEKYPVTGHIVVKRRGYHIFYAMGSHMAVRLSILGAGHPLTPERFLVLISVRGWVNLRAIVRLEGLGQMKNPMISSGVEPATFRLVAQCLAFPNRNTHHQLSVSCEKSCLQLCEVFQEWILA